MTSMGAEQGSYYLDENGEPVMGATYWTRDEASEWAASMGREGFSVPADVDDKLRGVDSSFSKFSQG